MLKLASLLLGFSLAFSTPVAAQDNSDAAKAALEFCLESFPDISGVKKALVAEGWQYRGGGEWGLHLYVRDGLRGLVATTLANAADRGCIVSASKMKPAFAMALAAQVLEEMTEVEELGPEQNVENVWRGKLNGRLIELAVITNFNLKFMRGAAVSFIER